MDETCVTPAYGYDNFLISRNPLEFVIVDKETSSFILMFFIIFQEILSKYKEFITMCQNFKMVGKLKCIAVVIMAHGGYGYIKCQTKELEEEKLKLRDFFSKLESCSELQDIPKIFIIESCRKGNPAVLVSLPPPPKLFVSASSALCFQNQIKQVEKHGDITQCLA